jgi:hypothetical protein
MAYAAGLVVGWHSHTANDIDARQVKVWQRFLARQPFWPMPRPPAGTPAPPPAAAGGTDAAPPPSPPPASAPKPAGDGSETTVH